MASHRGPQTAPYIGEGWFIRWEASRGIGIWRLVSKRGHWRSPHLPAAGCRGGNLPSQLQTSCRDKFFFPPFPGITILFLFFFSNFFPFGEVPICFTFITSLHYVLLCAAEHEPRTSCREIQSEQLLLFQHVSHSCFSSVISLFFFFLSPPFFLRLEQIQYDWQEIGRLQRSRGSDFSSK